MPIEMTTALAHPPPATKADLYALDETAFIELAIELAGRPVPGVRMTAEEYLDWAVGQERDAELVEGKVILMPPSNIDHESLDEWLGRLFGNFVEQRDLGRVLRNMAVRMKGVATFRVPDVMFIANEHVGRLHRTYIDGPPDLAVEIVSPDSTNRDRREKYLEYEAAGLREYWILDPAYRSFDLYRLVDGAYELTAADASGRLASAVLPGVALSPEELFGHREKVATVLKRFEASAA